MFQIVHLSYYVNPIWKSTIFPANEAFSLEFMNTNCYENDSKMDSFVYLKLRASGQCDTF